MTRLVKIISIILFSVSIIGCSSIENKNIKNWLEEGTKENRETAKKNNKTGKTHLKDYLQKSGCVNGSSAKIVDSEDKEILLYKVTCVTKSKKFLLACTDTDCSQY
jgi:hypothetical protein